MLSIIAAPIIAASLVLVAMPAHASPEGSAPPAPPASVTSAAVTLGGETVGDGYVIVDAGGAVNAGGSTFYPIPSGPVSADTLIVIPDANGNLPGGLTRANLKQVVAQLHAQGALPSGIEAEVATSNGTDRGTDVTTAPAVVTTSAVQSPNTGTHYSWAATSAGYSGTYGGDYIIGVNSSATTTYVFYTAAGTSQGVAGSGKGHYTGYNGSDFGVWTTYYGLGSTGTGGTSHTVPWGNVADSAGFQGWCTTTPTCLGNFYN